MRRLLTLLIGLVWLAPPFAAAQAQQEPLVIPDVPALAVTLEPAEALTAGSYVQGQLLLRVRVVSAFPFESLDLDLPRISKSEIIRVQRPRTREVRSYAGSGYAFETVLAIFPKTSGLLEIPGVRVRGGIDRGNGDILPFQDQSETLQLDIAGVDPGYQDPWWLVSEQVTVSETWSKPVESWRRGEIVRREVTVTATGVTGARLPELDFGPARGMTVADAGRTATTKLGATGAIATVTQSWDVKIETAGVSYIRPLRVPYWHPIERSEKRAALPGMRIEPLPADERALATALLQEAQDTFARHRTILWTLIGLVASPLVLALAALLWAICPTRADLMLRRRCAAAPSRAELYRAVADWTSDSKADDASALKAHTDSVARAIFSARTRPIDAARLAQALTANARAVRLGGLWNRRHHLTALILGPVVRLDAPGHRAK